MDQWEETKAPDADSVNRLILAIVICGLSMLAGWMLRGMVIAEEIQRACGGLR